MFTLLRQEIKHAIRFRDSNPGNNSKPISGSSAAECKPRKLRRIRTNDRTASYVSAECGSPSFHWTSYIYNYIYSHMTSSSQRHALSFNQLVETSPLQLSCRDFSLNFHLPASECFSHDLPSARS